MNIMQAQSLSQELIPIEMFGQDRGSAGTILTVAARTVLVLQTVENLFCLYRLQINDGAIHCAFIFKKLLTSGTYIGYADLLNPIGLCGL